MTTAAGWTSRASAAAGVVEDDAQAIGSGPGPPLAETRPFRFPVDQEWHTMDSAAQMCLVCQTPLDPDDEVIQAVHGSPADLGGQGAGYTRASYAHLDEDAQIMALGGWTIVGRGRLRDLTSRDVMESSDRL
jgi:hypothetical protein